jgi:hypothetical protein
MREDLPKKYLKSHPSHPKSQRTPSLDTAATDDSLETVALDTPTATHEIEEDCLQNEMESPWRIFVQRWRRLSTRYKWFTAFALFLSVSMVALSAIPPSVLMRVGFAWAIPASTFLAVAGLLGVTITLLLHGLHIALQSDNPNELGARWRALGNKRYVAAIAMTVGVLVILCALFPAALGSGAVSFMGSTFQNMRVSALFITVGAGLAFSALVWHMRALNQPRSKPLSYYDSSEPFFVAQSLSNTMQRQMHNAGPRAANITFFFIFFIGIALVGLIFAAPYFNFMGNAFAGMSVATVMKGVSIALIPVTLITYVGYALLHKSDEELLPGDSGEIRSDGACFSPTSQMPEIAECSQRKQKKQITQTAQTTQKTEATQTTQTKGISLVTELDPLVVDPTATRKGKKQTAKKDRKIRNKDGNKKQRTSDFAQRNRVPAAYTAPSALFFSPQIPKTVRPVQSRWQSGKKADDDGLASGL